MLTGLMITGVIYVLVSLTAVAIVPIGELTQSGATPLLTVVQMGAPNLLFGTIFPFISMFAVANTALINMLMASRLVYGMAKQDILPPVFGKVLRGRRTPWVAILFTAFLAGLLITFVGQVSQLGGTTALLLLAVFTLTNAAVMVLRKGQCRARALPCTDLDPRRGGHLHVLSGWSVDRPAARPVSGVVRYLAAPLISCATGGPSTFTHSLLSI